MASSVAAVGRAAPALLRWATVAAPGRGRPLGLDVDGGGHGGPNLPRPPASGRDARMVDTGHGRVEAVTEPFEPLLERDVDPDPLVQFGRWFDDAATVVAATRGDGGGHRRRRRPAVGADGAAQGAGARTGSCSTPTTTAARDAS